LFQSAEDSGVRMMAATSMTYVVLETGLVCWIAYELSTQVEYCNNLATLHSKLMETGQLQRTQHFSDIAAVTADSRMSH
jgi:hypothetical protein